MSSLQGSICKQLLEQLKPEGFCCNFRLSRFNCIRFIFRIENRNQRPSLCISYRQNKRLYPNILFCIVPSCAVQNTEHVRVDLL